MNLRSPRLSSLDILRGLDLFMLVALGPILMKLPFLSDHSSQLRHTEWIGFTAWDLIMPLFMFMSGVTISISMKRYREGADRRSFFKRLIKRFVILWILGMVVQGNLLSLKFTNFCFFSNTLQAIAIGYLFTAIFYVYLPRKVNYIIALGLLLTYWAALTFGGDFTPDGNLAEAVDKSILGGHRDGATWNTDGSINFAPWYHYTWILSSLGFIATVMIGMFAGEFLMTSSKTGNRKTATLAAWGAIMVSAGWLWGLQLPVIKTIWTSSMVLVSSGYCFLLLALFYWVIDVKGWTCGLNWLKIYGMNSILAYVMTTTLNFSGLSRSVLYGLEQYTGNYYPFIIQLSNVAIIFALLWHFYRHNKFLRV